MTIVLRPITDNDSITPVLTHTFRKEGFANARATCAKAIKDCTVLMQPRLDFRRRIANFPAFERFFHRGRSQDSREADISTRKVGDLPARAPIAVTPDTTIRQATEIMRDARISCLGVAMDGVVPLTDLGRVYALIGQLPAVNTRARLEGAAEAGTISPSGARNLLDACDLIAETGLQRQLRRARAGLKPDNFIAPSDRSDFERNHLRDAVVVVRNMQSAIGSSRGARS